MTVMPPPLTHTHTPTRRYLNMDEAAAVAELGVDFAADLVTAEMKAGDVLLLNNHIPHRYTRGQVQEDTHTRGAHRVCICVLHVLGSALLVTSFAMFGPLDQKQTRQGVSPCHTTNYTVRVD